MSRESIVRCTCERCSCQEEIAASFFVRYPKGWRKVEGKNICEDCAKDFRTIFNNWMAQGKKGGKNK